MVYTGPAKCVLPPNERQAMSGTRAVSKNWSYKSAVAVDHKTCVRAVVLVEASAAVVVVDDDAGGSGGQECARTVLSGATVEPIMVLVAIFLLVVVYFVFWKGRDVSKQWRIGIQSAVCIKWPGCSNDNLQPVLDSVAQQSWLW